jgi:ubiquinone/menaquinone biosynthesis C-methylase UbiE
MNHWAHTTAAARYALSRPFHQHVVIERIRAFLKITRPVRRALDVGCGTGMSTVALKAIADEVVGLDSSPAMLSHARRARGVRYVNSCAETLPFADETFRLITVSSAFHWLDRKRFLAEAARVLEPRGWLVIYNNAFLARMRENPDFHAAFRAKYPKRFPTPIRYWKPISKSDARPHGLDFRHTEKYENDVAFTPPTLVDYLSSHSNVIAAVEGRGESLAAVRKWILDLVTPFFRGPRATFQFGGTIWYVQKMGPSKRSLRRQKREARSARARKPDGNARKRNL